MRTVDLIRKKRDGGVLTREELAFLVSGYSLGAIPDYQVSAFLMAVVFQGMAEEEMATLTREMQHSGAVLDLSEIPGRKVDKHSTGGVGDKTSLVIAPVAAAAGVVVPMISGRGLAHTGGTLDKLESIPGFNVRLSPDQIRQGLTEIGVALAGQTDDLVPADRKLYSLRDVTATVESRPLIAASIMSKKLAEGIDGLVLDVKTGSGAFMKSQADAEALASAMVAIGKNCGKQMVALITDMNQPLGRAIGNSLEVEECLDVLRGEGPDDLVLLCQELSAYCLLFGGVAPTLEEGRTLFRRTIDSGRALDRFRAIVRFQGGDARVVDDPLLLPRAGREAPLESPGHGFLAAIETQQVGLAMCVLGAGRETVDSIIDPAVGMKLDKKIGDHVERGEPLGTIFYNDEARYQEARRQLLSCFSFSPTEPPRPALIKKIIS